MAYSDFIGMDPGEAGFLRNFNQVYQNAMQNMQVNQQQYGMDQAKMMAAQMNRMGIRPDSGVYGAALARLGEGQAREFGNLNRDLQNEFLRGRMGELQFGEGQRQYNQNFGEEQRRFNNQFGENQYQFRQNFGEGRRQFDVGQLNEMDRFNRNLSQQNYHWLNEFNEMQRMNNLRAQAQEKQNRNNSGLQGLGQKFGSALGSFKWGG